MVRCQKQILGMMIARVTPQNYRYKTVDWVSSGLIFTHNPSILAFNLLKYQEAVKEDTAY